MSWTCLKPSYLLVSAKDIGFISAAISSPDFMGSFSVKRFAAIECFHVTSPGNSALLSRKRFLLFRRKNKVTGHMSENRHLVPYGTLHSIYQALVQPHFNYCNIV